MVIIQISQLINEIFFIKTKSMKCVICKGKAPKCIYLLSRWEIHLFLKNITREYILQSLKYSLRNVKKFTNEIVLS